MSKERFNQLRDLMFQRLNEQAVVMLGKCLLISRIRNGISLNH